MADYYEVDILCTASESEVGEFHTIDRVKEEFGTSEDVIQWLKERYCNIKKRTILYSGSKKCGYVYLFDNMDLSHSPVEHWVQRDWVNVYRVHTESCFNNIKYEE